jgi:GNAT superfamily N-acetyltransferase
MLSETLSLPIDERYTLVALTPDDGPEVQALLERSADYSELVMGLPPGPAEAQSLYIDLPEGTGYEDKLLLGVFTGEHRLVGALDAVRDHPERGEWWIGLLLLEPEQRSHGLGERIYHVFERWAGARGAQGIRLAVLEQNVKAERFWRRLGFDELERKPPHRLGALMSVPIVMRRELA